MSEYCLTSLSAQSWQYRDRREPKVETMPYSYQMTSRVLYSARYHFVDIVDCLWSHHHLSSSSIIIIYCCSRRRCYYYKLRQDC